MPYRRTTVYKAHWSFTVNTGKLLKARKIEQRTLKLLGVSAISNDLTRLDVEECYILHVDSVYASFDDLRRMMNRICSNWFIVPWPFQGRTVGSVKLTGTGSASFYLTEHRK